MSRAVKARAALTGARAESDSLGRWDHLLLEVVNVEGTQRLSPYEYNIQRHLPQISE
jgi:hypothetical protein